jgi:hypothetical protein
MGLVVLLSVAASEHGLPLPGVIRCAQRTQAAELPVADLGMHLYPVPATRQVSDLRPGQDDHRAVSHVAVAHSMQHQVRSSSLMMKVPLDTKCPQARRLAFRAFMHRRTGAGLVNVAMASMIAQLYIMCSRPRQAPAAGGPRQPGPR